MKSCEKADFFFSHNSQTKLATSLVELPDNVVQNSLNLGFIGGFNLTTLDYFTPNQLKGIVVQHFPSTSTHNSLLSFRSILKGPSSSFWSLLPLSSFFFTLIGTAIASTICRNGRLGETWWKSSRQTIQVGGFSLSSFLSSSFHVSRQSIQAWMTTLYRNRVFHHIPTYWAVEYTWHLFN